MAFLCPQPSAPATPDYAAAATAQGQANKDTAITQGYLNNPNVIGPLGGQTVTFDPVTNQPTITQNLTPTAQTTLDAQQRVQQGMASLGEQGLRNASTIIGTPFQYTGPQGIFSLANPGQVQGPPQLGAIGSASGGFAGDRAVGAVANDRAVGAVANDRAVGSVANPQAYANVQGGTATGNFQGQQATGGVTGPTLQQSYGNYGAVQNNVDPSQYGLAGGVDSEKYGLARSLDSEK
jgi:hypothetical protein